ncbi:MAG: hypothetical protein A2Y77_02215 [Planctomycetes bacterium RBG_13_62_9]|nr:MAG: hypothetical protein A2Y77_02215 [Planctomycetes bacterium RBG_13_62_9]
MRRPRRYWLWSGCAALLCLVLLAALFHGCEQRQIVRPTPQMNADSPFWVRVLLAANVTECSLTTPSVVVVHQSDQGRVIQAAHTLGPIVEPTKVTLSGGRLLLGGTPLADRDVTFSPDRPHVFSINGESFRGKLRLVVDPQGQRFDVINLVPLEPYLAGVVGEEMPDYWEPEALKAQAIAARTYCLYIKNRFGAGRTWDVSRTQASQVYGGVRAESSQAWNAVNSTSGKILVVAGPPSRPRFTQNPLGSGLFPTYYSSVCGGHTTNSEDVFGDSFGPLEGVPCPYCKDVARLGVFFWPMARFDRQTVTRQLAARYPKLEALGEIQDIVITGRRDYGQFSRLTQCKLVGATGKTDTLRAEDLRLAIDPTGRKIKSTICRIVPWADGWAFLSGRGWGHGVGMCQCGAEGLARLGHDARQILRYYYPGSEIVGVY